MKLHARLPGFTFIELMVVIAIVAVFSTLVTVVSVTAMTRGQVHSQVEMLLAALASQQQQAANRVVNQGATQDYGLYFFEDGYVLFEGAQYLAGKATNQTLTLPTSMKFSTINLPNHQVVFSQSTGFVKDFQATQSGVIVTSQMGTTTTLTINRLGVVEVQ